MPTVQNLSVVQRKCGVRGGTKLHEHASTMNRNENPVEEGETPWGEEGFWDHSPRQKPSRRRRGGGGGCHNDFPGVEISIAGGVGEMVRGNYCDSFFFFSFLFLFFFFLFFNLDYELFLLGQTHTCAHPMVLGTTDFLPSMGHIVQNLQLQSITPSLS